MTERVKFRIEGENKADAALRSLDKDLARVKQTLIGVAMEHYIAWQKTCYWITPTLCPSISVPAGFTSDGLPVGIQIVGRHRDDFGVLPARVCVRTK